MPFNFCLKLYLRQTCKKDEETLLYFSVNVKVKNVESFILPVRSLLGKFHCFITTISLKLFRTLEGAINMTEVRATLPFPYSFSIGVSSLKQNWTLDSNA